MAHAALLDIQPETLDKAEGPARELMEGAKARLGFLPNMYTYMARFPAILDGYMSSYEAFRADAGFSPAEQETVFLTISRVNGCRYCMAAHSMIADKKSGVPEAELEALRAGETPSDPKLKAVAEFTEAMVTSRGSPGQPAVDAFMAAGYGEQQVLGVVLAIACKTFSNYVNQLSGTPVDDVFAPYAVD